MMIPRTRVLFASLGFALLALFVASCSQPSGPAASGGRSFGVTPPPTSSSSNFNLATPSLAGSQTGAGEVTITWANGGTTGSELSGGEFYPVTGEWVGSDVKPGSGHTEVYMWNSGTNAWDQVSEETDGSYAVTGLADGTYSFYVKEKSMLNATGRETETFHSNPSNVAEVTVQSCVNVYSIGMAEQPGWNSQQGTGLNPNNPYEVIVKKGNANNSKFNFHFTIAASCPGYTGAGHTVVVDVVQETAHGTTAATEDLLNPGKYLANGIWYPLTAGTYDLKITVDGVEVDPPGTWKLKVIN